MAAFQRKYGNGIDTGACNIQVMPIPGEYKGLGRNPRNFAREGS